MKSAALLLLLAAAVHAQQITPIQVPKGHLIGDFQNADVNGDGLLDVVLSTVVPAPEGAPLSARSRSLSVYLQRKGGCKAVLNCWRTARCNNRRCVCTATIIPAT